MRVRLSYSTSMWAIVGRLRCPISTTTGGGGRRAKEKLDRDR
jgi:hypothetical protein